MESKTQLTSYVPTGDVRSQLPIFQILGNQLPEKLQTPEAKLTIGKILFWTILGTGTYIFFQNVHNLLGIMQATFWFIAWGIATLALIMASPHIIRWLHMLTRIMGLKGDMAIAKRFSVETLRNLVEDAKDALNSVRARITQVEATRISMITESDKQNTDSEKAFDKLKTLTQNAAQYDKDADKAENEGDIERANRLRRKAKETRVNATLAQVEGQSFKDTAAQYAQYANQFGQAMEILRDNESGAVISVRLLDSSINIIERKLDATKRMSQATKGLAGIFQVTDQAKFQWAFQAATDQISSYIATTKRNLQLVSESRLNNIQATKSQADLESFVQQLNSGQIQKLNVNKLVDPSYQLKPDERVDKSFNVLD